MENGHPEVPEVHDHLEVPYKVFREWVIKAKDFAFVRLTPTNCYIGLLYLKKLEKTEIIIISDRFQLIFNKKSSPAVSLGLI